MTGNSYEAALEEMESSVPVSSHLDMKVLPIKTFSFSQSDIVPAVRRDWGAAIELVNEASEAVRMANERTAAAERKMQEMNLRFAEQLKAHEAKVLGLEKKLHATEMRAADAEEWLSKLYDKVLAEFGGVLRK